MLPAQPYAGAAISFNGMAVTVFGEPAAGDAVEIAPSTHQPMFETLRALAGALETPYRNPTEQARFGFALDRSIEDLDQALEKVAELRATTGARINSIEAQRLTNEDMQLNLQTLRSQLQDVDLDGRHQPARARVCRPGSGAGRVRAGAGLSLFNFL